METIATNRPLLPEQMSVDYPQELEVITSAAYSFRIGAPEAVRSVEARIDEGPWRPCRESCGFWWYDWSGYGNGLHEVLIRAENPHGWCIRSSPRKFMVRLG